MTTINLGVLCLQGGFREHFEVLQSISNQINIIDVRYTYQLKNLDGLIIPGGESTVQGILLEKYGIIDTLKEFVKTKPVWGVCAGAIMLSEKVTNQQNLGIQEIKQQYQPLIGGLNVTINRNYFGRQIDSAVRKLKLTERAINFGLSDVSHFIRAPAILDVDPQKVNILATVQDQQQEVIVAVQQSNILATVFHPEITDQDYTWHSYFLNMIRANFVEIQKPLHLENLYNIKDNNLQKHSWTVKIAMPKYLKGGVIMDVVNPVQAKIAEAAGACSVMALERIPADIKADGGVARMSDPKMITDVMQAVSIPVMAKSRIGHFGESQILEALGVDCIDESEVLTAADTANHIDKHQFKVPFVCGAQNLGEALRRISEGAAMIRMKGNAGTGNVLEAVQHTRQIFKEIRRLQGLRDDEIYTFAKEHVVPLELVKEVKKLGRLPVVTFAAGGIATPADVILLMELGVDGVFVGSGIFKSDDPQKRAKAMVDACAFYKDKKLVAKVSEGLGKAMVGILEKGEIYAYSKL